jgi:hypothetical protein
MKRLLLLLCACGAAAWAAEVPNVRRVYLLPMARGMDQFLANRLTNEHIFEVVTDPKLADAVFTDRIGEGFEAQLEEISPKPANPEAKPKPAAQSDNNNMLGGFTGETVNKLTNPAISSTFGRGRGTIFLVWAKSRQVVWSVYEPPRDGSSKELDRTASAIVSRLKKDLNPKQK